MESRGRVCAVRADEVVERHLHLWGSSCHACRISLGCFTRNPTFDPGFLGAEVGASQLVIEEQLDIGCLFQLVEKRIIQRRSIDRIDGLWDPVNLEIYLHVVCTYPAMNVIGLRSFPQLAPFSAVDHASIHGDRVTECIVDQLRAIGVFHGRDATLRKGQVNRLGEIQWHGCWVAEIYRCAQLFASAR